MPQYKLTLPASSLALADRACEILSALDIPPVLAVSMFEAAPDDWTVEAYFETAPDADTLSTALASCGDADGLTAAALTITPVPNENWVALSQAALPPVRAGRFVIHGSHDRASVGRRPMAIEIDAGEAFGTAHHDTTRGCLLSFDQLVRRRRFSAILDLGCGAAVLAIAAAKTLPEAAILASDIDPRATQVAMRNIVLNGVQRRIKVVTAAGIAHAALARASAFDLIFANILAAPLITLASDLSRIIKPGGVAILSGLLVEQAREIIAAYRAIGFHVLGHKRLGEWSTLTLQKRR